MAANKAIEDAHEADAKAGIVQPSRAVSGAGDDAASGSGHRAVGAVHLGGAAAEASASEALRLEALRVYLGQQLGQDDFLKLYRELQKDEFFDAEMDAEWASALGKTLRGHFRAQPERFEFIPIVEQLLRREAVAFRS
jgi:hypothetical protein